MMRYQVYALTHSQTNDLLFYFMHKRTDAKAGLYRYRYSDAMVLFHWFPAVDNPLVAASPASAAWVAAGFQGWVAGAQVDDTNSSLHAVLDFQPDVPALHAAWEQHLAQRVVAEQRLRRKGRGKGKRTKTKTKTAAGSDDDGGGGGGGGDDDDDGDGDGESCGHDSLAHRIQRDELFSWVAEYMTRYFYERITILIENGLLTQ